jgi:hypothetical protein
MRIDPPDLALLGAGRSGEVGRDVHDDVVAGDRAGSIIPGTGQG